MQLKERLKYTNRHRSALNCLNLGTALRGTVQRVLLPDPIDTVPAEGKSSPQSWKVTLAYDGTDFSGWQVQPGRSTIQGVLADAICSNKAFTTAFRRELKRAYGAAELAPVPANDDLYSERRGGFDLSHVSRRPRA